MTKFSSPLTNSIIQSYDALQRVFVRNHERDFADEEDKKTCVKELNRYLIIRSRVKHHIFPAPGKVDDLWRAFLAMSEIYYRYCEETFGFLIHRDPFTPVMSEYADDSDDVNPLSTLVEIEESAEP